MTDDLIFYELQEIHEVLIKTKEENNLNFRMIKPTEKFNFSEPILNTTKLGLDRLSVHNWVLNLNRRNNQFLYAGMVLEDDDGESASGLGSPTRAKSHALAEPLISNNNNNTDTNITFVLNYNYKGIPLLYTTITPGAYELFEIEQLIKEETNGNVIIEPDKNTMKCIMENKQGALSFDVENSIASLLGFRKILCKPGHYTSQKIIDDMCFGTINIYSNVISGVRHTIYFYCN